MTNEEKKVVRAYLNNWIKDFEKQVEEFKTDLRKANDILEKRSNEMLAKHFFNLYTDPVANPVKDVVKNTKLLYTAVLDLVDQVVKLGETIKENEDDE